jgi:hypothetical protein
MKSYEERQQEWIKKHNLVPGDSVRVFRKAESKESGWGNSWVDDMDALVGHTFEFGGTFSIFGIWGENSDYFFPFFVLKPRKTNNVQWKPKNGERVWCICMTDSVIYYSDIYSEAHATMFGNGLIRRTREEARKIVREIKNIL